MKSHWTKSENFYDIFEDFEPPSKNFLATRQKYAENFLIFDLLLSNGFKKQNIFILGFHVVLSIGMQRQKIKQNCLKTLKVFFNQWLTNFF